MAKTYCPMHRENTRALQPVVNVGDRCPCGAEALKIETLPKFGRVVTWSGQIREQEMDDAPE